MSPEEALALVEHELGSAPRRPSGGMQIDRVTRASSEGEYITDECFYSLFTDARYRCLDVNDFEGADLICNLCEPIPEHMEASFDFIVDGSTLDNVFDPAAAVRNLARLLRPGGRILHANHAARVHYVYVGFALSWFHDFYAINGFEDCQVYLAQWEGKRTEARWDFYHYQPVREQDGRITYFGQDRYYFPWREGFAVAIAEKGNTSTWHRAPVQYEYRSGVQVETRDGQPETVHQSIPADLDDPYVAASLHFYASRRRSMFEPTDKVAIPHEFLHYSPETPYCGSVLPLAELLMRRGRSRNC
jgi:SAM-dependent methyltransferase